MQVMSGDAWAWCSLPLSPLSCPGLPETPGQLWKEEDTQARLLLQWRGCKRLKQSALGMCGTVAWINWEGGDICVQIQDYIVASTLPLHVVPQNVCTVLSKYFILFQISESSAIFKSLFLMFYKKLLMRYRYKQEHRNGFRCYEVITLQCLLGCGTSESSNCLL